MNDQYSKAGMLYIVATPIGNLGDLSQRAIDVLSQCDMILAEDTRHSRHLLQHHGINVPLQSCHEHNESERIQMVLNALEKGNNLALISDAGTPLISDPGFVLVRAVREHDFQVSPIPGASSIIAALSVAGLPTDRFIYDGFLPAKRAARQVCLKQYLFEQRTIVLLESSHRISDTLADVNTVFGPDRNIVLARELTKKFETVLNGTVAQLQAILEQDNNQLKGEFVVLIAGSEPVAADNQEQIKLLKVLMSELPVKQAAALTAKALGLRKNDVYKQALELKGQD